MIHYLLKKGANLNVQSDEYKRTPLFTACINHIKTYYPETYYKSYDLVKLFLEHGADSDIQDIYGDSALNRAIYSNKYKEVKLLLDYGADINIKNNNGITPFDEAMKTDNKKIIELLKVYKTIDLND